LPKFTSGSPRLRVVVRTPPSRWATLGGMYILGSGIIIFLLLAVLVVFVWMAQQKKRKEYEASED
jgi:hypothetical protein